MLIIRGDIVFEKSSEELALHKLYILYILNKMQLPLTNGQITNIFIENDILDYFSLQEYLHQLNEAELIMMKPKNNLDLYSLSDKGKLALNYFNNRIDSDKKDSLDLFVLENKENILRDREVKTEVKKLADGQFDVKLEILDNNRPYISVSLNVPTNKTANIIAENWKNNTSNIYSSIIETLIKKT